MAKVHQKLHPQAEADIRFLDMPVDVLRGEFDAASWAMRSANVPATLRDIGFDVLGKPGDAWVVFRKDVAFRQTRNGTVQATMTFVANQRAGALVLIGASVAADRRSRARRMFDHSVQDRIRALTGPA